MKIPFFRMGFEKQYEGKAILKLGLKLMAIRGCFWSVYENIFKVLEVKYVWKSCVPKSYGTRSIHWKRRKNEIRSVNARPQAWCMARISYAFLDFDDYLDVVHARCWWAGRNRPCIVHHRYGRVLFVIRN